MSDMIQVYDDVVLTLGTLAGNTVLSVDSKIDASRESGFKLIDGRFTGQFASKTDGDGPYWWGIACNLSSAQIQAILTEDIQNRADPIARGPSSWLKILGQVGEVVGAIGFLTPNGDFVDQKINWSVPEGSRFAYFVFNFTGAAFTTGQSVLFQAVINGVWLRD